MPLKICLYGPESVGKTTTAKKLAKLFNTSFAHEVSRDLLNDNAFSLEDMIKVGHAQTKKILDKEQEASELLICDTDLITSQIYSEHYLKDIPDILFELEHKVQFDHYFLLDIDVPWIDDGLRDLGHLRRYMFKKFKWELQKRNIKYTLIQGGYEERIEKIKHKIDELLILKKEAL